MNESSRKSFSAPSIFWSADFSTWFACYGLLNFERMTRWLHSSNVRVMIVALPAKLQAPKLAAGDICLGSKLWSGLDQLRLVMLSLSECI
ncbi:hypothetical protein [Comamonas aquatilis]|uniref:hypothetical protein n=1 Tax=Comamonas aquatilis TaxID=1778406 RepID=UPI0039EFF1DB